MLHQVSEFSEWGWVYFNNSTNNLLSQRQWMFSDCPSRSCEYDTSGTPEETSSTQDVMTLLWLESMMKCWHFTSKRSMSLLVTHIFGARLEAESWIFCTTKWKMCSDYIRMFLLAKHAKSFKELDMFLSFTEATRSSGRLHFHSHTLLWKKECP